jgi:citrate lyase gamma subunit
MLVETNEGTVALTFLSGDSAALQVVPGEVATPAQPQQPQALDIKQLLDNADFKVTLAELIQAEVKKAINEQPCISTENSKRIDELIEARLDEQFGNKVKDEVEDVLNNSDWEDRAREAVEGVVEDLAEDAVQEAINDHDWNETIEEYLEGEDVSEQVEKVLRSRETKELIERVISEYDFSTIFDEIHNNYDNETDVVNALERSNVQARITQIVESEIDAAVNGKFDEHYEHLMKDVRTAIKELVQKVLTDM